MHVTCALLLPPLLSCSGRNNKSSSTPHRLPPPPSCAPASSCRTATAAPNPLSNATTTRQASPLEKLSASWQHRPPSPPSPPPPPPAAAAAEGIAMIAVTRRCICSVRTCSSVPASQSTTSLPHPITNTLPSPMQSASPPTLPGKTCARGGRGGTEAMANARQGEASGGGEGREGGGGMQAATCHAPLLCEPHRMTVPSRLFGGGFRMR